MKARYSIPNMEVEKLEASKATQDDITRMELELHRMESALNEAYYEFGKVLLEIAETESRKINKMVDEIIETEKKLAAVRQEKNDPA